MFKNPGSGLYYYYYYYYSPLQILSSKTLYLLLQKSLSLEDLVQLHYRSNAMLLELFDLPNNEFFPWVGYYLLNFRNILTSAFENGVSVGYKAITFRVPTLSPSVKIS